ncbi:MAG: hypothetical protein U9Q83_07980 [Bacteroidota bacterium]|nr:hypothetical protein [Bacteroidota bacterium]
MSRFLKKILFTTLIFICILYVVQVIVDTGLKKVEYNKYHDWNLAFKGTISSEIIILGTSRAWVHYDPQIIENVTGLTCYNLGLDASNLLIQQAKWNVYKANNKLPEIIVQNIDLNTLTISDNIGYKDQYLPYLNYNEIYKPLSEADNNLWKDRWIPLYKYHGYVPNVLLGISSFLNLTERKYDKYKGYKGHEQEWNKDFEKFKKTQDNNQIHYNNKQFSKGFALLDSLINECKKNNITLILSWSPQYYKLIKMQEPKRTEIKKTLQKISENNTNVEFWDYSEDSLNLSKEYFYNSMHLNKIGAEIFSKKFSVKLNKLLRHD